MLFSTVTNGIVLQCIQGTAVHIIDVAVRLGGLSCLLPHKPAPSHELILSSPLHDVLCSDEPGPDGWFSWLAFGGVEALSKCQNGRRGTSTSPPLSKSQQQNIGETRASAHHFIWTRSRDNSRHLGRRYYNRKGRGNIKIGSSCGMVIWLLEASASTCCIVIDRSPTL